MFTSKEMTKTKELNISSRSSARELDEAGVNFSKIKHLYKFGKRKLSVLNTSLFNIKFQNELMKIPCFEATDAMETILRNLS
ncbi:hypothetical protein A4A49_30218 [Nicotiana attenuata]|uniref:Uncharacterized protein n=1 Tax=Nicotiana attenuata TaxID=49451 RepID=A0A1J6KE87_NICAT|nr:hypothetical protein A4A49_30218 [Nicotiana attenuata]